MSNYKPPYSITSKMVNLISSISEELTRVEYNKKKIITPQQSTKFVEFMLEVILNTTRKVGNGVGNDLTENQIKIIENIALNPKISAVKLAD